MKRYLIESATVIKDNYIFIFLIALTHLSGIIIVLYDDFLRSVITAENAILILILAAVTIILMLIIRPTIYGRLVEIIENRSRESLIFTFMENWLNFYIVMFVLWTPIYIVFSVMHKLEPELPEGIFEIVLAPLIGILEIYIIPLIFIRGFRLVAIPKGIKILISNIIYSLPLILLSILIPLTHFFYYIISSHLVNQFAGNILIPIAVACILSIVAAFIELLIFTTASMVLIRGFSNIRNLRT
jgi:hypothetical protein